MTSIGLWAGLLPIAQAQTAVGLAPAAEAPAITPDMPGQPSYAMGSSESGILTQAELKNPNAFGWTTDARDGEGPVSIVTFKTPNQTNLDETAEDLNILSLIFSQHLEHALGGEGSEAGDYKLGIPMLLQTEGRLVEASYLEGFGAIFNMKVRFPLVPAAVADKETQSRQMASEWEEARRALAGAAPAGPSRVTWYVNNNEKVRRYNPKLVDTLKKRVIELLRNASNLRHVQPDEWIAVTFAGPPNNSTPWPRAAVGSISAGMAGLGSGSVTINKMPHTPSDPSQPSTNPDDALAGTGKPAEPKHAHTVAPQTPERATLMTIRIKKKDADAFAANQMSEEQFFHAAEITSYLGPVIVHGTASDYYLRLQNR